MASRHGANQFTSPIRFDAIAWSAHDRKTGAYALVIEESYDCVRWSVTFKTHPRVGGTAKVGGTTKTATAARAACRRAIERVIRAKRRTHTAPLETFGQRLRGFRVARDVTVHALARAVGITPLHLSDLEHDRRRPCRLLVVKLAGVLGVMVPALSRADA